MCYQYVQQESVRVPACNIAKRYAPTAFEQKTRICCRRSTIKNISKYDNCVKSLNIIQRGTYGKQTEYLVYTQNHETNLVGNRQAIGVGSV